VAGATDVLDGWLARHRGETTATGALIDPLTDKIFVAVVVATLAINQLIPAWSVPLLVTRELGQVALLAWTTAISPRRLRGRLIAGRWPAYPANSRPLSSSQASPRRS